MGYNSVVVETLMLDPLYIRGSWKDRLFKLRKEPRRNSHELFMQCMLVHDGTLKARAISQRVNSEDLIVDAHGQHVRIISIQNSVLNIQRLK
jgi:hypothetical protein